MTPYIRLLIALSCHFRWTPDQLDIKGAFLYGYLKEEIYMKLSNGYEKAGYCAKLNRSIYGLKQSPKTWYGRLTTFLLQLGGKKIRYRYLSCLHHKATPLA